MHSELCSHGFHRDEINLKNAKSYMMSFIWKFQVYCMFLLILGFNCDSKVVTIVLNFFLRA